MSSRSNNQSSSKRRKRVSSKSLLIRLAESCHAHRTNFHSRQEDDTDYESPSEEEMKACASDMEKLRNAMPRIEAACHCKKKGDTVDAVDAKQVNHLCLFYNSVVEGVYCPQSMELLFDNGRLGIEIIPRVFQLLRHLSSKSIIQDVIKSLENQAVQVNQESSFAHNENSVEMQQDSWNQKVEPKCVADQIANTCAVLINSIPDEHLQKDIVHDLIQTLQSLIVLNKINVFQDRAQNDDLLTAQDKEDVSIAIFVDLIQQPEEGLQEFVLGIVSSDELFLLQSTILRILFQLFVMQSMQQVDGQFLSQSGKDENARYSYINHGARYRLDFAFLEMLIQLVQQILEGDALSMGQMSSVLLMTRSKLMATNLLHLLGQECMHTSFVSEVHKVNLLNFVSMIPKLIKLHFLSSETITNEKVSDTMKDAQRSLFGTISSSLSVLVHEYFLTPSNDNFEQRQRSLTHMYGLIDCVPHIITLKEVDRCSSRLVENILRAIHVTLENWISSKHFSLLGEFFMHCNSKKYFGPLVSLLSNSNHVTTITVILACFSKLESVHLDLRQISELALMPDDSLGSKRRRLDDDSNYEDTASKSTLSENDVTFVSSLAFYFRNILRKSNQVPKVASMQYDTFVVSLEEKGVHQIFDAIFVLETLAVSCEPYSDEASQILEMLYTSSIVISEFIAKERKTTSDVQKNIASLLSSATRLMWNPKVGLNSDLRTKMLSTVSLATSKFCLLTTLPPSSIEQNPLRANSILQDDCVGLPPLYKFVFKNKEKPCSGTCKNLKNSFGSACTLFKDCCCHFYDFQHSTKGNTNKTCYLALTEDSLSAKERCLLASLQCLLSSGQRQSYESILKASFEDVNIEAMNCLPILVQVYASDFFEQPDLLSNKAILWFERITELGKRVDPEASCFLMVALIECLRNFLTLALSKRRDPTVFDSTMFTVNSFGIWEPKVLDSLEINIHISDILKILHEIEFNKTLIDYAPFRKSLLGLLKILHHISPKETLSAFNSLNIDISDNENELQSTDKNGLFWLLHLPFADENDEIREISASWLGSMTLNHDQLFLRILYDSNNVNIHLAIEKFFSDIDSSLDGFCGLTQIEASSTMRSTLTSTTSGITKEVEMKKSLSAVRFLSTLCRNHGNAEIIRDAIVTKVASRLFRIWINFANQIMFKQGEKIDTEILAQSAFCELLCHRELFQNLIPNYQGKFLPGILCEILSRTLFNTTGKSSSTRIDETHRMVCVFIESFMMKSNESERDLLEYDRLQEVLKSFDFVLPNIIAGLVLEQDLALIRECTRFRLFLLSELRRLQQKHEMVESVNKKKTDKPSKRRLSRRFSSEELQRHASKLCISKSSNLNILGCVIKALLLEQDKAPIYFFLHKIGKSKITLSTLLQQSNFFILDELLCELGECEEYPGPNDFEEDQWKSIYKSKMAFQALQRAALSLCHTTGEDGNNEDNNILSLHTKDLVRQSSEANIKTLEWIRNNFMRLLVSVSTKWKRGSLEKKISAMRSLRVLLRFVKKEESAQFTTQIFGIIDGCMHLKVEDAKSHTGKYLSRLQFLSVRCLSHFIRILLTHDIKVVGDHLCHIVVSLSPLFSNSSLENEELTDKDDFTLRATDDAVDTLELLVDGKIGKRLSKYFQHVPFLPLDQRLQHVRGNLKRFGVNFENLLLLSTQISTSTSNLRNCEGTDDEDQLSKNRVLCDALIKRLHSLGKLLDHENRNVRRISLVHIKDIVRSHRELFEAVIRNEDMSLRFLTVKAKRRPYDGSTDSLSIFVKLLLKKCATEKDDELRNMLATCLGEIGGVDPSFVGTDDMFEEANDPSKAWLLNRGVPWKSKSVRYYYQLQLITSHFVAALRAAPTPTDQHKIAFAIQELLKQIHIETVNQQSSTEGLSEGEMNPWLKNQLVEAGVLTVIEPYWKSQYSQTEASKPKTPPFFISSKSYYLWLADLGRYMIERSYSNETSCYREMFYACRSAIRSQIGLSILEFLLPLLILDALCFGNESDKVAIINELQSVLNNVESAAMDSLEIQKSVECIFSIIQIFQHWNNTEQEDRYKQQRGSNKHSNRGRSNTSSSSNWPADDSMFAIEELLEAIPFDLCAKAASKVGMFAQSLQFLEIYSRKHEAKRVFDIIDDDSDKEKDDVLVNPNAEHMLSAMHTSHMDFSLANKLFGELNDRDSMSALMSIMEHSNPIDRINEKKSHKDWDSVLRLSELTMQIGDNSSNELKNFLKKSQLEALLEKRHYESVLANVESIMKGLENGSSMNLNNVDTLPYAIKASWHLGRWDELNTLVDKFYSNDTQEATHDYELAIGKSMTRIHRRKFEDISQIVHEAREGIMPSLSVVANEGYHRAYPYLLKLQCLREIEDVAHILSDTDLRSSRPTLFPSYNETSMDNLSVRIALSNLASNTKEEASLWLTSGEKARKEGLFNLAESSFTRAKNLFEKLQTANDESSLASTEDFKINLLEVNLQLAKVQHEFKPVQALHMIKDFEVERIIRNGLMTAEKKSFIESLDKKGARFSCARNLLQQTEWIVESGLQAGSEVTNRYKLLVEVAPKWEKANFMYAKYLDSVLESRINILASTRGENADDEITRGAIIKSDKVCRTYLLSTIQQYINALRLGQDHVFQALPRMLTLWFDFTAIVNWDFVKVHAYEEEKVGNEKTFYVKLTDVDETVFLLDQESANEGMLVRNEIEFIPFDSLKEKEEEEDEKEQKRKKDKKGKKNKKDKNKKDKADTEDEEDKRTTKIDKYVQMDDGDLCKDQKKVNAIVLEGKDYIAISSLYTVLPQLISRINHIDQETVNGVKDILQKILEKFPAQSLWHLSVLRHSTDEARAEVGKEIFRNAQKNLETNEDLPSRDLLESSANLMDLLIKVAKYRSTKPDRRNTKLQMNTWGGKVTLKDHLPPIQATLTVSTSLGKDPFPRNTPRMRGFNENVTIMSSKAKPKRISAFAVTEDTKISTEPKDLSVPQECDIGQFHFLLKQEAKGDLRKDARVQDLNTVINRLFATPTTSSSAGRQQRRLKLRTFSVVCLSEDCGILEWVPNTNSFRNLVSSSYNPYASHYSARRRGRRITNFTDPNLQHSFAACQNIYLKTGNLSKAAHDYKETMLKEYPPVFYWWFVQNFQDPHKWFEARTRFALSAASWAAVGHMIGLGDRHSENILIDTTCGECVHVDFDCIFDKGLTLPTPEVVPFRLTPNMLDGFGPTGADGVFTGGLTSAMTTLRQNRDVLLSVLEPFIRDPVIDWKTRSAQNAITKDRDGKVNAEAKRSIRVIDERLRGIYNLKNPNFKKVKRTDRTGTYDEVANMVPLSVEGQVQKMIVEATSHENLVLMYVGWMSWL